MIPAAQNWESSAFLSVLYDCKLIIFVFWTVNQPHWTSSRENLLTQGPSVLNVLPELAGGRVKKYFWWISSIKKKYAAHLDSRLILHMCLIRLFFFHFCYHFFFITLPSCIWSFYCMELALKKGERLKGLVLAADAWRALLKIIGMIVS